MALPGVRGGWNMIKAAVCGDETSIVGQIEKLTADICRKEGITVDIDVFYNRDSLEGEMAKGERYDLLYLDIQMKGGNGITAARYIREMDENVIIILVSAHEEYMMELFRLDVFSLIMKPINGDFFTQVFLEAYQKICRKSYYFSYHYKTQEFKIPCKDILYFESRGRQIHVHSKNGETNIFYGKLSDVEGRLAAGKISFLRIHQSFLVNYHAIRARSKTEVALADGTALPISEDRKKVFGEAYAMLLGDEISI